MSNIEAKLKDLILARYGTLKDFTPHTGLSYSTVDTILRRGIKKASISNVINICRALGISADELANGRIVPTNRNVASRTVTDIDEVIAFVKEYEISIDGQPLSESEFVMFLDGINVTVGIIKRKRERKMQK